MPFMPFLPDANQPPNKDDPRLRSAPKKKYRDNATAISEAVPISSIEIAPPDGTTPLNADTAVLIDPSKPPTPSEFKNKKTTIAIDQTYKPHIRPSSEKCKPFCLAATYAPKNVEIIVVITIHIPIPVTMSLRSEMLAAPATPKPVNALAEFSNTPMATATRTPAITPLQSIRFCQVKKFAPDSTRERLAPSLLSRSFFFA
jgi:hypothetical protein